jgi:imidazolonepropionase-like amidohydrolase
MKRLLSIILAITLFNGCKTKEPYDLAILHANILDVKTGQILKNKNVFIRQGTIENIGNSVFKSKNTIDANGKLLTPGFVDTHIHPTDVFGDYERAPKFLPKDSLGSLRKKLSDEYLPYGTTTVMTMGQPENWLKQMIDWTVPQSNRVDFMMSGGAFVSKENRTPYVAHTVVSSPMESRRKILEAYSLGIRHLKLYSRLREPEFSAIMQLADSLKIKTYGHIGDFNPEYPKMQHALKTGMVNFEHIVTIPNSVILAEEDWQLLNETFHKNYGEMDSEAKVMAYFLEQFRFVKEHKAAEMSAFIQLLASKKITLSTTIHRVYEQSSSSSFTKKPMDTLATPQQLQRSKENFAIVMQYAKQMHDNGVEIRFGSDMPHGGKVNLSELNIFAQYGFDIAGIFKIATYNGAKALGIDDKVGSVEAGKKANLILWEKDPFEDFRYFNAGMKVIKDGSLYE